MDTKEAREVAAQAVAFFNEMHADQGISDVHVEEIELSPDRETWYVTVGFARPAPRWSAQSRLAEAFGHLEEGETPKERDDKRIVLQAKDLEVVKMVRRETVS